MDSITKSNSIEESLQTLVHAAETIDTCGNDIRRIADSIMHLHEAPGDDEVSLEYLLRAEVDDLKKRVTLQTSVARQLVTGAMNMAGGFPFVDQLSEEVLCRMLLKMSRGG